MVGADISVSYHELLNNQAIAISISESPDMGILGLDKEHLDDAMAEVARHLLAIGAQLIYGGDLRPKGFTEVLFELVARYRRDADLNDERIGISNLLAWPVHINMRAEEVEELSNALSGAAELVCLTLDGHVISPDQRRRLPWQPVTSDEWVAGLTAMRATMTAMTTARIVLGGRVKDFKGRMPGVGEEVLTSLRAGQPLFLLGGFGGCARDIAEDLDLVPTGLAKRPRWPGRDYLAGFTVGGLNNGLDAEENKVLAATVHVDEAVALILRGLLRLTEVGRLQLKRD